MSVIALVAACNAGHIGLGHGGYAGLGLEVGHGGGGAGHGYVALAQDGGYGSSGHGGAEYASAGHDEHVDYYVCKIQNETFDVWYSI